MDAPNLTGRPSSVNFGPAHSAPDPVPRNYKDGPLHGYGIVKAVEKRSDARVRLDPANLYRTLRRMRRDGWVEAVDEPDPEDARRRNFRLTPEGRAVVRAEVERLVQVLEWAGPLGERNA